MPLFKRSTSKPLIPPIQSTSGDGASSHRIVPNPNSNTYTRSGLDSDLDRDKKELFAGYNPTRPGSGRCLDEASINEEEDVEAIKQKTRFVKQESVNSTQSSIRLAREAVETGNNTLRRLGEQSERLGNTEYHLDIAKGHSARADDRTEELRKLNRSIFIPVVTFDNDAKHAAREAKVQRRHEERRVEHQRPLAGAQLGGTDETRFPGRRVPSTERSRFQFEANASDDEMENELERNLDEIQGLARNLKALGTAMGGEIDRQNGVISGIEDKVVKLDGRLHNNTSRLHIAGGK
ncbi:hypothetical protein C8R47DRAFT_787602 [Mycena vitilis]|nr:hypothetical protein C8R47DRAFT_787602 [Mycena vitilis]